jgi:ABC-type sugar transport system ATPase subunit
MTKVELQNIAHSFAAKPVLCDISLSIESGEYVVLLGQSGGGKSTLLRIVAGLQTPDAGDVRFNGESIAALAPRQRDVSLVPQQDGLYPHRTVAQSLRMGIPQRLTTARIESQIRDAVRLTGIEAIADRYPAHLSGGELRRAAIAKAIARRASVRLLDEPLSALDAPLRQSLQDDLLRWHRQQPGTTIHVTHDGQEAMRMADRIAIIEAGRVAQFGTPDAVYENPASVHVARSIGTPSINLFYGQIRAGRLSSETLKLHVEARFDHRDAEVLIGIRPAALRIGGSRGDVSCDGAVIRMNRCEVGLQVELRCDQQHVQATVGEQLPVATGEFVRLSADAKKLLVFDASSGQRIRTYQ